MFDPLHKWLGIPPEEQPPNHYRLLGLTLFESDEEAIDAAADRQLGFLHGLANSQHAALAEQLSNQVSLARLTLIDDGKRATYNASLSPPPAQSTQPPTSPAEEPQSRPPVSTATSDVGWYLRHHDQVSHGPFSLETLEEAVRAGNVAHDTEVYHERLTEAQWTAATRINVLGKYFAPQSKVAIRTNGEPASGRGLPTKALNLAFLVFFFLGLPAFAFYSNPSLRSRLLQWFTREKPSEPVREQVAVPKRVQPTTQQVDAKVDGHEPSPALDTPDRETPPKALTVPSPATAESE
ncbi:MAG: GYF domain-containing protein [Rubripirellula sp.]